MSENIVISVSIQLPRLMTGPQIYEAVKKAVQSAGNRELEVYGENHPTDPNLAFFGQHSPHPNQQVALHPTGNCIYFSSKDNVEYDSLVITAYIWHTYCWREDENEKLKNEAVLNFTARLLQSLT